jgi:hypothetical protein
MSISCSARSINATLTCSRFSPARGELLVRYRPCTAPARRSEGQRLENHETGSKQPRLLLGVRVQSSPAAAPSWAFGEPQKSIRLIAIRFGLQILYARIADGYNHPNRFAMGLDKKRLLTALSFANRIIQRDFPPRGFIASNVGNPFMWAHSFGSVNALYLHGVRHKKPAH